MLGLLVPGSSVELLKLTLFTQVPIMLLTPFAGALIDRWNKPVTILVVSLARAVILLFVPAAFFRSNSIYAFYAAACLLSTFDLVFAPTRSALLPRSCRARACCPQTRCSGRWASAARWRGSSWADGCSTITRG